MIQRIPSAERYHAENEWLSAYWHFSFDTYRDPSNVSFGPLRVFNNDTIAPGGGFPAHPHREMEIVTYVIKGEIEHRDTMGNSGVIKPGEIQRMSAGTGLRHSEFNPSHTDATEIVQLWLFPAVPHLTPSWEQKAYSNEDRQGRLLPIAVPAGSPNKPAQAVEIHQDATIYTCLLAPGQSVKYSLVSRLPAESSPITSPPAEASTEAGLPAEALAKAGRAYIFVIDGEITINGQPFHKGDQARITNESTLLLSGSTNASTNGTAADFLLLDLP